MRDQNNSKASTASTSRSVVGDEKDKIKVEPFGNIRRAVAALREAPEEEAHISVTHVDMDAALDEMGEQL